ncbi:hypothetical protein HY496_02050 [Candidatus Woesearchaeota archaeon]|nr:hypothetical protein [Candidatus Woesearchaeota archaeon]
MPDKITVSDLQWSDPLTAQDLQILAYALDQIKDQARPEGWQESDSICYNQWRGLLMQLQAERHPLVLIPSWVYGTDTPVYIVPAGKL